jgi:DNA-binding FrmR family transcriptional regulator
MVLQLATMSHTIHDKTKLLNRVRRIKGQIESIERALEAEGDSTAILHTLAACHGAINGFMSELLEGHIRHHVIDPNHKPSSESAQATDELIQIVKRYVK